MPCFDGRENTAASSLAEENSKLRNRLDVVTRAACELLRLMPGFSDGAWDEISPATIKWAKDHRAFDRKRSSKRK